MSLHKITAGVGYDYLTRQVAAMDSSEKGYTGLASYYAEQGETPGVWVGSGLSGLDGLAAGDVVTAQQMQSLFGSGHHPLARQRGAALAADATVAQIHAATRLGQPFRVYAHDVPAFHMQVAKLCAAHNTDRGLPADWPVPRDVRAAIRTQVGTQLFRAEHGRDPEDARELHGHIAKVSRPQTTAVAGFDLTFSPVKSVSALWALADPATAATIERAHRAAIADALRFLETHALFTRTGPQAARQVDVQGLIGTAFTHRDSRAGDPDLHTHVAVANKVQTLDGRWLAIDGRPLYKAIVAASEVYNTALERHLCATLPVRFADRDQPEPGRRPVRELLGVDPALTARWSARRASIEQRQAELAATFQTDHGRPPTAVEAFRLAQQATLETRQTKHAPRRLADQRRTWRAEADAVLGPGGVQRMLTAALAHHPRTPQVRPDARWVTDQARAIVAILEASRSTWQDWHVRAEALRVVRAAEIPLAHVDEVVARLTHTALTRHSLPLRAPDDGIVEPAPLRRRDGQSVYHLAGSTWHTSRRILAAEQRIVEAAGRRGGHIAPDTAVDLALLEAAANRTPLNAGQAALVRAMATSGHRLQLAIAPAGSGKTTAMQTLATAWRTGGGTVIGLAPSASAAAQLGDQIGGRTDTMAILTHALNTGGRLPDWARAIGPNSLVIIDEAGMADTLSLDQVVDFVLDRGGSVRLIGDDQQLAAIGAGGVLRDLATTHGALRLNELVRFADPAEAAASLALRDGDPAALGYYLDQRRIHVGDLGTCADAVFAAWTADRAQGTDALMLAPTRDLVADLNARAQAHLHPTPGGPTAALADGNTATVGDVIITRRNDRRLPVSPTDWVKNGDRWRITALHPDGSLRAVHLTSRLPIVLPAGYVTDAVELGYACTIHAAQGVTADVTHGVLTGTETRQQLYTMLTRGRHANHLHLEVVGDGDVHTLIRPEAIRPPTATDLLEAVLARDDTPTSAHTTARHLTDPATRLADAVTRYTDAVAFAAEHTAPAALLTGLDVDANQLHDGLTDAPAWPTLRAHLLMLAAHGTDPLAALTAAAHAAPLGDAHDPAAVLDWRLDPTGARNTRPGPLPWLPAVPDPLAHHHDWGDYLNRRHQAVVDLALQVRTHTAAAPTPPAWTPPGAARLDPDTLADLAVWRAAHGIPDSDTRPTGERQHGQAERRHQTRLDRRVIDHLAPAAAEWTPLVTHHAPAVTGDPFLPMLTHRLAQLSTVGLNAGQLLRSAAAEGVLPDDHPAAALWWRINRHLTPAVAARLDTDHTAITTNWLPTLQDVLGSDRTHDLQASSWWPALVTTLDHALARGWHLPHLLADAPAPTGDVDDCQALLWRTSLLLAPVPDDEPEPEPTTTATAGSGVPEPVVADRWELADEPADPEATPPDPHEDAAAAGPARHPAPAAADTAETTAPMTDPAWDADADSIADLTHTLEAALRRVQTPVETPEADLLAQLDRADAWRDSGHTPDRLAAINALALEFYQACYRGSWAQPYLTGRFRVDLTDDPDLRPGYAPDTWTALITHLRHHGVTDPELLVTGLATTATTGRLIDRFRDRAVFPILHQGQVLGFVGRRHPAKPDYDPRTGPKYLNTPDTLLFHKRAQLFVAGQRHLDAGGIPVLVEGPADAIAVTTATGGRYVGVAPLGTHLTSEQANQLRGWGRDPIIATDNDVAGQTAAQRDYWMLTPHLLQPRHAQLPDGTDPADLVAAGRGVLLVDALDTARPLADTLIDERFANLPPAEAALEAMAVIAARPVDDWEPALSDLADRLGVPADLLRDAQLAHLRAFNDDPLRVADQQLARTNAVRDRLATAALTRRWAPLADSIDPRLVADQHWPGLATALDQVHRHGHDPRQVFDIALNDGPLDPANAAADLTRRLRFITNPEPATAQSPGPRMADEFQPNSEQVSRVTPGPAS
jgi:DNA primase catalytic core